VVISTSIRGHMGAKRLKSIKQKPLACAAFLGIAHENPSYIFRCNRKATYFTGGPAERALSNPAANAFYAECDERFAGWPGRGHFAASTRPSICWLSIPEKQVAMT
jgi:hypothetical protein